MSSSARFSLGLFGLLGLLALGPASAGCGPVCLDTQGSCLDLHVEVDGKSSLTFLHMDVLLNGKDQAGLAGTATGRVREGVQPPVQLLVQPPPNLPSVETVTIEVRSPLGAFLLYSGSTAVNWPAGGHIQATLILYDAPP